MTAMLAIDVLKAAAVLMLARIGVSDFRTQKIRNQHVAELFAVALAILLVTYISNGNGRVAGLAFLMSAVLFFVLVLFWLLGKVGAGDVKLMATMPILVGFSGSIPFVAALLVFSLLVYAVAKFPVLLPRRWFRTYIQSLASSGRVPFGVPIAAAGILALLLTTSSGTWLIWGAESRALIQDCQPWTAALDNLDDAHLSAGRLC
ncbi:MAG TPA: prepilin peptidase [Devosiaceae bacterium]|nr:prepilin peptidase [Devosiaceae bacterium]